MQPYFKKWGMPYLLLGLVVGFFIFFRLDRFSLWQDEADLAMLSKSVLQTGLPLALVDGKLITQWGGNESNANYLWHMDPWPLFYLRAASFKFFGISEWSARFPCALLGFLSLIPLGLLTFRWTKKHCVTWLTLFFFGTNPWVILYIRQSKYWPIVFFAYGLMLLGYQKWEENKKGGFLFTLSVILLFHCNYFTAALSLLGFGAYTLFFAKWEKARRRFFWTTTIALVFFCLPFFALGSFEGRVTLMSQWPTLFEYFNKLGTHIFYFNRQICPLILVFLWVFWWKKTPKFLLIASAILAAWFGIALLNFDVLRFNLQLIPLFCILMAITIAQLYQKNKIVGTLSFVILWGMGLFQSMDIVKPEWLAMKNYYFTEYADPPKMIPQLLLKFWKPGEHAYLNHNQGVWQFYSDIPLAYQIDPKEAPLKNPPLLKQWTDRSAIDWWVGPHLVKLRRGPYISEAEMIEKWKSTGYDYEVIDTKIPVLNWDLNSPIRYKHFLEKFSKRPSQEPTIRLLHRIKS